MNPDSGWYPGLGFPQKPMVLLHESCSATPRPEYYRAVLLRVDTKRQAVQLQWVHVPGRKVFWLPIASQRIWCHSYKYDHWVKLQKEGAWRPLPIAHTYIYTPVQCKGSSPVQPKSSKPNKPKQRQQKQQQQKQKQQAQAVASSSLPPLSSKAATQQLDRQRFQQQQQQQVGAAPTPPGAAAQERRSSLSGKVLQPTNGNNASSGRSSSSGGSSGGREARLRGMARVEAILAGAAKASRPAATAQENGGSDAAEAAAGAEAQYCAHHTPALQRQAVADADAVGGGDECRSSSGKSTSSQCSPNVVPVEQQDVVMAEACE